MPTVASFIESAKAALMAGEIEQAAAICRHVLDFLPKHIEATCLLAEALRDQGQVEAAQDLYLRVVSADPTNLVAHWALSLVAEAEGDQEWAVWELTRAWEASPWHPELRSEVLRLTGQRPSLTPFALAQVYAAGGLHDKAIGELRRLFAAEPSRLDVAVALADALWRTGRGDESTQICESILKDSPDCLRANLVLGYHLFTGSSARREQGLRLLERAMTLDPSGAVAAEVFAGQVLPEVLTVQPPEISPLAISTDFAARSADEAGRDAAAVLAGVADRHDETGEEPRRGRASDLATWLQDQSAQSATVREALESRLSSLAAQRPEADWQAMQNLDPEWQELLAEEITLDEDSEERLSRALSEMGLSSAEQAEAGWVEVPTSSGGVRLSDVSQSEVTPPPPPTPRPAPAARRREAERAPSPRVAEPGGEAAPGPAADFGHARALWQGGEPEAAVEEYRHLLGADVDDADRVVEALRELLGAHPDLAVAHRLLGDAYMRSGRFQQAIDEYNWVLSSRQPGA